MGSPVHLGVGVDDVVERLAFHSWEAEIPPVGEQDSVLVVGTKEILAPFRILERLGGVHRQPAVSLDVQLCPAVIAVDLPLAPVGRHRKAHLEAGRDSQRPRVADDEGVEVGAITALRVAGPVDVAPPPAVPAFVVLQVLDGIVVDCPDLLDVRLRLADGLAKSLS